MNKNLIYVAVAVIALLLLGGGAYFIMNKNSSPAPLQQSPVSQNTPAPQPSQPENTMKTLKDLLATGTSQKCTYSDNSNNIDVSGTTYISAGKIRGDFNTTTAGKIIAGHMIVDGKTSFVWMDGQTTGFKMSFDATSAASTQSGAAQQGVDPDKAMDYSCSPWSVDSSLFIPPTTVKFSDFGSLTVPPKSGAAPTSGNQCSACDYLSGDEKTQCLTALKCN